MLEFFKATINLELTGVLYILGNQCITWNVLSSSVMFKSNVLRSFVFALIINSVECVFAKSVERSKFFADKAKLFAALSMITTAKRLWSAYRYDLTSGSHDIDFVCLSCTFCLSF